MAWNITENGNVLNVAIDGRLVAAVAPTMREEILSKLLTLPQVSRLRGA